MSHKRTMKWQLLLKRPLMRNNDEDELKIIILISSSPFWKFYSSFRQRARLWRKWSLRPLKHWIGKWILASGFQRPVGCRDLLLERGGLEVLRRWQLGERKKFALAFFVLAIWRTSASIVRGQFFPAWILRLVPLIGFLWGQCVGDLSRRGRNVLQFSSGFVQFACSLFLPGGEIWNCRKSREDMGRGSDSGSSDGFSPLKSDGIVLVVHCTYHLWTDQKLVGQKFVSSPE